MLMSCFVCLLHRLRMFQALFCSLQCICVLGLCISFIPYQNFKIFSGVQKHPRVQFIRMLCSNWAFILKYLLLLGQPRLLIWIVPLCCETSTNEFWLTYNFDWQIVFTEHLFQGCCNERSGSGITQTLSADCTLTYFRNPHHNFLLF